jgi:hypothetical protein
MANLTMSKMYFATATQGATNSDNMMTPDPKEIATGTGGGTSIDIDLGVSLTCDTFFAGFISSNVTQVALSSATGLGTGLVSLGNLNLGPTTAARRHAFLDRAAVSSRYWRFGFTYTGTLLVGIIGVGASIQPTWGHEWGSGRQMIDNSLVTDLRGGGFAIERGAVKGSWNYTLGDLTDTDLAALWALTNDIGISQPVLVMEDPALTGQAMNDALHYGLLDKPDVYERLLPGTSRWSFRVQEWV